FRAARARGVSVGFEASVCGGIPIVRALAAGLAGDRVESLRGILNGTCNYVLTRMGEGGLSFDEALREAQERGFAESDPSLDVDGADAAHKLKILAELAFGVSLPPGCVEVEGLRGVGRREMRAAARRGRVLKHVAVARDLGSRVELRVGPELLPRDHPLAQVRMEDNAVLVRGAAAGELFFRGKGAGGAPTASAVLSDIIELSRPPAISSYRAGRGTTKYGKLAPCRGGR
ncbi:MAG: homoserine dehydrogenase, partial [Planctomycetota bacterium]